MPGMTPKRRDVIRREAQTMLELPGSPLWPARAIELLDEVERLRALWADVANTSARRESELIGRREHAEKFKADLAEMTRLRDNALRAAEQADQSIDVDLEGDLRDGFHGLYDWDEEHLNRVVNRAGVIVRPIVAHAVKRAETAESERDAMLSAADDFLNTVLDLLPATSRVRVLLAQLTALGGGEAS